MRVALFVTCFNDTLFPGTGRAVVELLERLGLRGRVPRGADLLRPDARQLRLRATTATALAERFERVFADYEAVVSPSRVVRRRIVREHSPAVARPGVRADRVPGRRLGVEDVGASFPHRVTLHPTCHSLRLLQHRRPAAAAAARGARASTSSSSRTRSECCGFGGTFAVKNADTSMAMLSDKLRHVLDTRAEVCTSADNSCLMHIGGALRRQRAGVRTMHLAEILAAQE